MQFPISKTLTATAINKSGMTLDYDEVTQTISWSQTYLFVGPEGQVVKGIQISDFLSGQISVVDMQANYPDVLNALIFIWDFLDGEIKKQEGIT